ncbi:MAG: hypothetical protein JO337_13725, partial [Acidimicrobiales bacterium]|nr:hypothetical protein [Acidimicrobiales bacterium]
MARARARARATATATAERDGAGYPPSVVLFVFAALVILFVVLPLI